MIIFVLLGFIAAIFQLVALREFTFSIAKNEFAFVLGCGLWLFSSSLGSLLGKKKKISFFTPLSLVFAFGFSLYGIHLAKALFGLKYYAASSIAFDFLSGAILIVPLAFLIGYFFADFSRQKQATAKIFGLEAIGFFLGASAFTFLFCGYTNPLIFSCLPLLLSWKLFPKKIVSAGLIIFSSLTLSLNFGSILKKEFSGTTLEKISGSAYGPLIRARLGNTRLFFSSGCLVATSEDASWTEEFIHTGLSAHEKPQNILFIGAGLSGEIQEIYKHKINSLDYVQINPIISEEARRSGGLSLRYASINFIADDPRAYLRKTTKTYDAILLSMPAPLNLSFNRYFTQEFFTLVYKRLSIGGIFAFYIPSKRDILSPQIAKFNSSIINSVDKVFKDRLIVPSDSMIVISARENALYPASLLENYSAADLENDFFTFYHLKNNLDESRRIYAESQLNKNIRNNTDFFPSGFLNYLLLEQLKFYPDFKIVSDKLAQALKIIFAAAILLLLLTTFVFKKTLGPLNVAAAGFTAISCNTVILVLFQLYSGTLFWKMGILAGLFMLGLATGSFILFKNNFLALLYACWAILLLLPFTNINLYLFSLACGFLTGCGYSQFIRLQLKPVDIYSADLSGAFLGTLLSGIFFLPFLGVNYTLMALAGLCGVFALRNLLD